MNKSKKEQLIEDTLAQSLGIEYALNAAAHARRRRKFKRAYFVAPIFAVIVTIFPASVPRIALTKPKPAPVCEIISDSELVAQLADQKVLFIKDQTRITEVVFLQN